MFIPLNTIEVWEFEGECNPSEFFQVLTHICTINDVLVIGSYDVEQKILNWILKNEITLPEGKKPFYETFELNRNEYPKGRFYAFNIDQPKINCLSEFCKIKNGGVDRQLFFDHLLIYRPGLPLIPLLDFHDAFRGILYASGHFKENEIRNFAESLGLTAKLVFNPSIRDKHGNMLSLK